MAKKSKSDWKPSENILKYLKSWEKFRSKPYDDGEGNITVGYGFNLPHLLKKYKKGITEEQADKEFAGVVNTFVPEFRKLTPNFDNLNNNQRDALFSLYYNAGADTYMKSPMLFKYLKEGDFDKAVKEINHDEWKDDMDGQKKRRAFERRVFSTPTDQPWTVDDDSNYVLIENKPVEDKSVGEGTDGPKYEDARHVEAKYDYTGYVGRGYDGNKVRVSDSNMKSVGISNNADPDKWYESVNPILDTDPISLIADFIPTMKRMLDPNRERSGEDTATDFEEKMWKAYTDGDISRLPASKYRFDDDDNDAQYVGLPQEQAILIQSLLDKEYMNNMLDEAYKNADEKSKLKIRDYKKVLDKLNKNIFENPGKWILVNEGVSPFREEVYGDNFEKVNEASGLGALKNFSVRWDPDAGMLDVKDDYDFSRKKIAEDIIPERDVPLRIRERIKYDPKKGSVLRNNDKALPKRFVRKYEEGGEAKHWWSDTDKRDEIIKRQNDNGEWQEKRRRLLEQAHSDLEKGEIDEDEFRRIAGFSNSEIGNLIISKDGNGEKIGAIINNLLDSIDIDKVKGGIGDAKEGKEDKNKEDAYPYKLMVESLLTLADVASSTPGMLRLYNKMGLDLMPILKTIAESSKIQTIAGLSNIGIDGSQIALDPEGDNAFNYAGILGGAAEAIGGTNVVRNMSFMGRYGNKVDDILDIANPVISTLGIVDDVSNMEDGGAKYRYITSMDNASVGWDIDEKPEMEEGGFVPDWTLQRNKLINRRVVSRCKDGGVVSNSDFTKDTSMARDALRMDSSYNPSYSYIPQNNTSNHSFDIESLIKESSGIKPYDDMPDIKKHKVHKGDTLWSISKKTGVHIDDIILYNPQIKDINKIEIGDEVNLEAPISNPKALDYKEIKKKESVLNKSGDNAAIIKSVQHNNNFAIIDKKKKVIEVYSPDNELLYTGRIGTGRSGDDYNTITYSKKDGSIIDGKGNNSTPAGITWDGVLEHFKKPISYRSNGITQIKTRGDNYRTRVLYDKYGIDEESLKNPYMSGAGTMLRLASIYRDEVAGRKFKGPEGDIDPMDAVLYKWSGRNRLLRSGKANPKLDEYHNNVKKYASNFRINTVDKFDERLGGDEATVPDKPAMNIDDVTPSLVWEKNTGLSGVDERRQYVPLYAEGGAVEKQREAYKYLTEKRGMSKIQALAVIGNLMAESMLKDDVYGDNGTSYGIQQWHNERMDMLFKQARKKGHSEPTFQDQLEFLADEYEGKTGYSNFLYTRKGKEGPGYYNYSRQDFMNADNLKDAVVAWNQGAGRPHKSVIRNDDRYNYAMEVAKNLGLDIEENSVSSYGQMGFGDDGEIAASVTLPEVEVAAALPNPEAPSQERQSEEERFRTWTETYGKDIINHLLTLDRERKDGNDDDYSMMYKQREKESEEDKKMALINAVLPNIQLRIKGVTDN